MHVVKHGLHPTRQSRKIEEFSPADDNGDYGIDNNAEARDYDDDNDNRAFQDIKAEVVLRPSGRKIFIFSSG